MNKQGDFDGLMERALQNARREREAAITKSAELALQADDRLERQGNYESQLATETMRLIDRMNWLYTHPRLRHLIGRSAVQLAVGTDDYLRPTMIETPLILPAEVRAEGAHVLTAGYIFSCNQTDRYGNRGLRIEQAVSDATTGHLDRAKKYALWLYKDDLGQRVQADGHAFDVFRKARDRALIDEYAKHNPWVDAFEISDGYASGGRYGYSVTEKYGPAARAAITKAGGELPAELLSWAYENSIENELFPKLRSCEYPDDMYLEPLSLVQQANDVIGRRK